MEHCLYDSKSGYYTGQRKIFGPQGDYYTSPYTHRFFAECLAEAFVDCFSVMGRPDPFHLVELGAGERVLGRQILECLESHHPEVSERLCYFPIEVGEELPDSIQGIVFSNEFFDALPVHRVRVREGRLREIFVEANDGLRAAEGEVSDPRIAGYMKMGFERWRDGYEYEVNLRMLEVLDDLDRRVRFGFHLVVDYGYDWPQYDAAERPEGTLMCYDRHQAVADPFRNPGEQDMTSHVNFEVLRRAAERKGWASEPLRTQRQFLTEWGLERRLREEEQRGFSDARTLEDRLRLKQLLLPGGISDTMKVLVQKIRVTR